MSDDGQEILKRYATPHRRRSKRFAGADWTPRHKSADKEDGAWCRYCKMRHGYMQVGIDYEKRLSGNWVILWLCPTYGHVIQETVLVRGGK